jgi:hypothetical protein
MRDYGSKRYQRNPYCFTKSGDPRRGLSSDLVKVPRETKDPAAIDRKNRKEVVDIIVDAVSKGISLEEVISQLANDEEIKQKFKYLANADLKEIFKGWYNGRVRPKTEFEKIIR